MYNNDYEPTDYNSAEPAWQPPAPETPMNWYKCLIYALLFLSAIANAVSGFQMLTGAVYEGYSDFIYGFYPALSILDKIVGIGCIAIAVLAIYARQELAKFTAKGPQLITYLYAGVVAINAVHLLGFMMIVGDDVDLNMASIITQIVFSIVMVYANKQYFAKRSQMFVN